MIPYIDRMSKTAVGKWQCILLMSTELKMSIVIYANMCLYP